MGVKGILKIGMFDRMDNLYKSMYHSKGLEDLTCGAFFCLKMKRNNAIKNVKDALCKHILKDSFSAKYFRFSYRTRKLDIILDENWDNIAIFRHFHRKMRM